MREYDIDKWGTLLHQISGNKISGLAAANRLFLGDSSDTLCYVRDQLLTGSALEFHDFYINSIYEFINSFNLQNLSLVELGAGYGAIILQLIKLTRDHSVKHFAGELANSGINCLQRLVEIEGLNCTGFKFDFNQPSFSAVDVPHGSVLFTCMSLPYITGFPHQLLSKILDIKPQLVIHVEPVFQHWSDQSLLHMLWKKYSILNNYNISFYSDLVSYDNRGLLSIIEDRPSFLGSNPLFPVSFIAWKPC